MIKFSFKPSVAPDKLLFLAWNKFWDAAKWGNSSEKRFKARQKTMEKIRGELVERENKKYKKGFSFV